MEPVLYSIKQQNNVLLANIVSPSLASEVLATAGQVILATADELHELARNREKLLHINGLPFTAHRHLVFAGHEEVRLTA